MALPPNYFPADVSLRVFGDDLESAQALFPAAKHLLFTALRRQALGGITHVRMTLPSVNGEFVSVFLAGNIKQVYVAPAPRRVLVQPEPEEILLLPRVYPEMWTGVIHDGSLILATGDRPNGDLISRLHEFSPSSGTQGSAQEEELDFGYQDVLKLGVANAYPSIKPGMYTGAMKRVVQAIFGIGWTQYLSDDYLDTAPTYAPDRLVTNKFDYRWIKCHGIYRAANGHWVIEISKERGVLAMPLVLIEESTDPGFMKFAQSRGDVGTVNVLQEFGGLPNGESFPDDLGDLEDLITDGKVLRLLEPEDIATFYQETEDTQADFPQDGTNPDHSKEGWYVDQGWAFSDNGSEAHNTTRFMSSNSYIRCEHYKLEFDLSDYDLDETPVGVGTAVFTQVGFGRLYTTASWLSGTVEQAILVPVGSSGPEEVEYVNPSPYNYSGMTDPERDAMFPSLFEPVPADNTVLYVFFGPVGANGNDELEYVYCRAEFPTQFFSGSINQNYTGSVADPNAFCWQVLFPCYCREAYVLYAQYRNGLPATTGSIRVNGFIGELGDSLINREDFHDLADNPDTGIFLPEYLPFSTVANPQTGIGPYYYGANLSALSSHYVVGASMEFDLEPGYEYFRVGLDPDVNTDPPILYPRNTNWTGGL